MTEKKDRQGGLTGSENYAIKREIIEILKQLKYLTDKAKKLFSLVEDKK
jgi:hypothetical protein